MSCYEVAITILHFVAHIGCTRLLTFFAKKITLLKTQDLDRIE